MASQDGGSKVSGRGVWAGTQAPPVTSCVALGLCTLMVPSSVENAASYQSSRDNSGTHPAQGGPEGAEQRFPPSSLGMLTVWGRVGTGSDSQSPWLGCLHEFRDLSKSETGAPVPDSVYRGCSSQGETLGPVTASPFWLEHAWGLSLLWAAVSAQEETPGRGLSLFVDTVRKHAQTRASLWAWLAVQGTGPASCSEPWSSVLGGGPLLHLSLVDTCQLLERDLWFIRTKVSMTDRQPLFAF